MFKTKWTYIILGFVLLANLLIAFTSDDNFSGEVTFKLDYSSKDIFEEVLSIKDKSVHRTEIDTVILIKENPIFVEQWKEILTQGDYDIFEMVFYDPDSLWQYRTIESSRGISGEWSYVWNEDKSEMTIREISIADNFFYKWVYTIVGRDAVLNKLKETLINQLGEKKS